VTENIANYLSFLAERVGPLGAAQLAELLAYNTSVEGLDLRGENSIRNSFQFENYRCFRGFMTVIVGIR
jgi:hypothetical protein